MKAVERRHEGWVGTISAGSSALARRIPFAGVAGFVYRTASLPAGVNANSQL